MMQQTFVGALESFFADECPQLGGQRTRKVLVHPILSMVNEFFPETSHLRQGQIQWVTVDKDETFSCGKSMSNTHLKSVVLDLVQSKDIADRLFHAGRRPERLHDQRRSGHPAQDLPGHRWALYP